jgi:hypothetical protein
MSIGGRITVRGREEASIFLPLLNYTEKPENAHAKGASSYIHKKRINPRKGFVDDDCRLSA